ncbi:DNA polymerase III subunit beta family protein [Pseudomonas sp.]|uniref:DNA polymerase III subunit beta family protein n=1 Tax=Pseudomonas sp. TaxID=306 RepID=UPI003FD8B859
MEYLARVNPKYFAAMALFMAKQDVRYYLNGISVEPHPDGGAIIVATDGHRLAVIHDPDGWCSKQFIVGGIKSPLLTACKQRARLLPCEGPAALWIGTHGCVVARLPAMEAGQKAEHQEPTDLFGELCLYACKTSIVDGKFPDWRRVANQKRTTVPEIFPAINSGYVYDVSLAQNIILGANKKYAHRGVNMEHTGRDGSVVVRVDDHELYDRFFVVIMSMRSKFPETIFPKFMPQEVAPVQP